MTDSVKTLYLLDAYALIYRSYYAFINNPRITTTGINTSATFGFCNFLVELLEREKPQFIAVVFDPSGPTFRHEMFPAYKAQRPPMPEDLRKSIPYIKKIIEALGIECLSVPGYEADDLIGTLAKEAEKEDFTVYMITPDKDYAQLVSDKVFMYKPGRSGGKEEVMGIPEVLDHFGIERVDQVIDILGLMGDTADNVPGCEGIGPKTAASLVYKYSDIDGIYKHLEDIKGKQREKLEKCRDIVSLSRTLVTICTKVPHTYTTSDLQRRPNNNDSLNQVFNELELFSLRRRIIDGHSTDDELKPAPETKLDINQEDYSDSIEQLREELKTSEKYAISFKYDSSSLYTSFPTRLCFSGDGKNIKYINISNNSQEAAKVLLQFQEIFENASKMIIGYDLKSLIIGLKRCGIELKNRLFDISIAHYVIQPDNSHNLDRLALEYLNYSHSSANSEPQKQLSFFDQPLESEEYQICNEQCAVIFRLQAILDTEMEKSGLNELFKNIEMPLINVLADMEFEGVSVDINALHALTEEYKKKCTALEQEIYNLAGETFNIDSPKQMGVILFDKLKIGGQNKKTKSGQLSTSEQVLSKLDDAPIISKILEYRGIKKLLSTYAESLPSFIDNGTGKIHTCFKQAEAATGRLSCVNPNLQNIPIRTEEGRKIRKAFIIGEDGYTFFSADYSQVELRLMASISEDEHLIEAFTHGEDIHTETAAKIFHTDISNVTSEMRRRAKTANFGIIYGISAWGLAERLKISRKEGKELIDGYFELYPGVKRYMEWIVDKARKQQYVETIMGRRRYLKDINSRNAVVRGVAERNAVNAPIQGSAADIIKKAMIDIHRRLKEEHMKSKMIIQVHDELNFKCSIEEKDQLEQLVRECMENAVKLKVPLTVSCGFGNNWYEAH